MPLEFRPLLLIFLSFLTALIVSGESQSQSPSAQQLNQEGFIFLYNGAAAEALSSWQQAEELYRNQNNLEGITGTQLNQALAEQSLGLYPRACTTIAQAIAIPVQTCQPDYGEDAVLSSFSNIELTDASRIGIRLLGENLRLLGNLAEAESTLTFAEAQTDPDSSEASRIALALGSVHHFATKAAIQSYARVSAREVQSRNEITAEINSQLEQARANYRSAAGSDDAEIATKANLNLIELLVEVAVNTSLPQSASAVRVSSQLSSDASMAYSQLSHTDFDQLPAVESIYGRLNLAGNLIAVIQSEEMHSLFGSAVDFPVVERWVSDATALAEKIDDKRALSFAHGKAAELKALQSASTAAVETQYAQALALAQSVQAFDISYDWAYRLAQLSEAAGRDDKAAEYYESALAALDQVREDLIAVNSELRFDFAQKIEPVYRDYLQFLVNVPDPNFAQAVEVHESLQLAQLENFLRCGRLISPEPELGDVVTIHVINLDSSIEIILSRSSETYGYSVLAEEVISSAENLALNLQSPSFIEIPESDFLPYAELLYDKMLRPAVAAGFISNDEPLSFVLDAPFQTIPMGVLHDGQQYLAATHLLSNSLQLRQSVMPSASSSALFAGLSERAPSFSEPLAPIGIRPLPETEFEAAALKRYLRSKVLLDSDFTAKQLKDEVAEDDYRILHISTHGQFSSVPERTFLVAWDKLLDIQEMAQIFQGAGNIDLLVLSACQSAVGDERSTLGLAGLAVQSGARSAIASLWLVDSTGSSVLMDRFYEGLNQSLSNAEALQQAQLTLLQSSAFSHPFYWAPFVLIESITEFNPGISDEEVLSLAHRSAALLVTKLHLLGQKADNLIALSPNIDDSRSD